MMWYTTNEWHEHHHSTCMTNHLLVTGYPTQTKPPTPHRQFTMVSGGNMSISEIYVTSLWIITFNIMKCDNILFAGPYTYLLFITIILCTHFGCFPIAYTLTNSNYIYISKKPLLWVCSWLYIYIWNEISITYCTKAIPEKCGCVMWYNLMYQKEWGLSVGATLWPFGHDHIMYIDI